MNKDILEALEKNGNSCVYYKKKTQTCEGKLEEVGLFLFGWGFFVVVFLKLPAFLKFMSGPWSQRWLGSRFKKIGSLL